MPIRKWLVFAVLSTLSSLPALSAQDLLVCSIASRSVLRYDGTTGAFKAQFIPPGGVGYDNSITYGPDGKAYVSSYLSTNVPPGFVTQHDGVTGALLSVFVSGPSGGLIGPTYIIFGPDGNLYVSDGGGPENGTAAVKRYNGTTGASMGGFTSGETVQVYNPQGLRFGPDGHLYVADSVNILKYNGTTGAFMGVFVTGNYGNVTVPHPLRAPIGLTFGPDGNLYVASNANGMVLRYNGYDGTYMGVFATGSGLYHPHGVIFGPDGNLYVSDEASQVLRYNGTSGTFMDQFVTTGSGGLNVATGMTFTPAPPPPGPQYNVCLLYDPNKAAKSGSTLPIKLQLCDGAGRNLSSAGITLHATSLTMTSTSTSSIVVEDSGNANPDNDFRFDSALGGSGGYIFNLSTKGLALGSYKLNFSVTGDTATYAAPFQVTK
jgi:streptogramin lyase